MNVSRRAIQWLGRNLLGVGLLCGAALGAGVAPVPGSALPDAWGTAGSKVFLSVPEVAGKPVTISGVTLPSAGERVTVIIPLRTPPGRLRVQFVNDSTQQTITTRDIEVLSPEVPEGSQARRVQLLISPKLTPQQVDALLSRLLPNVGMLNSRETLPAPVSSPKMTGASPCGGTLAEIQLGAGITLEAALNSLAQQGGEDVWYPDPISSWGGGALTQVSPNPSQSGQAQTQLSSAQPLQQSFHYAPSPVLSRVVLGSPASGMTGAGVTIAVLDTGFSPQLDPTHELTDAQGSRLPRVLPPINALVPYDPANLTPSLAGSQDFWEGHGTQVAMLAAGALSGAAPGAGVLPIKVCSPGENGRASCSTKDVLRGLCVALNRVPAQQLVINLSLGGAAPTGAIHAVLNWAQLQGAVVVAAGGNQHQNTANQTDPEEYPAAFARSHAPSQAALPILAVASTTPSAGGGRSLNTSSLWPLSPFSTRGSYLNISAPGDLLDLGHVQLYSGTSFASPLVAGAAALARQANPNVSAAALRSYMLSGGRVIAGASTPASAAATQAAPVQVLPMLRLSGY